MAFLQIDRAANLAQLLDPSVSASIKTNPTGSISLNKPPLLMGLIFVLAGTGICFLPASGGTPQWMPYAAGGFFGFAGIAALLFRLENKVYFKIPVAIAVCLFLAMFHWISFGAGERIGTSTTPSSEQSGADVRWPFAIFTILMDLALGAVFFQWLSKRRKD